MEKSPDKRESRETWRVARNVVVISLAFMVHFTGYNGVLNLQSSIHADDMLGRASLAAVHAGLIFSNIFLPAIVIKWFGTKWAISVSFIMYMPYIAAQLLPRFWTMIPAGLVLGLGAGPLWCAKCIYLSVVSDAHSKTSKIPAEALLVRFLGLFFMIHHMSQVWSNLISSLVLSAGNNAAAVTALNASQITELCGGNFLPSADAGEALPAQPQEKIEMLVGKDKFRIDTNIARNILACMTGAVIIMALGVDSMKRYDADRAYSATGTSGLALLIVTLKLMMEPNQMMLIIINIFVGYQQAFFIVDFTAAFVSCAIGAGTVGFVMMTYGLANAVSCFVTGYLAKMTGRLPLICCVAVVTAALLGFLVAWQPQAQHVYILYILAALWGLCNSVWMVQINAYCGTLFPGREAAAFSNFRLWLSVGHFIAYIVPSCLRTKNKIFLLLAMMVTGVIMYFIVEFKEWKKRKTQTFCRTVYRFSARRASL